MSAQSPAVEEAAEFINFYMQPENLAAVAEGDWLIPASSDAADTVEQNTEGANGWSTILASGDQLTKAPFQSATNYPQWKDQIATPAFQRYLGDEISADELADRAHRGLGLDQLAGRDDETRRRPDAAAGHAAGQGDRHAGRLGRR